MKKKVQNIYQFHKASRSLTRIKYGFCRAKMNIAPQANAKAERKGIAILHLSLLV